MNKLSLPVLVLNKNWQAIGTTNLQRAISGLLKSFLQSWEVFCK